MNQENVDYLKEQVMYAGYGDTFHKELEARIKEQPEEFNLQYETNFGNDKVVSELNFSRSNREDSDFYFFNSHKLELTREGEPVMKQQFNIYNGSNITLKEAYNLMCGRAVNKTLRNKEGELYNTWIQLDFKHTDKYGNYLQQKYNEGYGYDVEVALQKYPISEMENPMYKTNLVESLKKGNPGRATLTGPDGQEQKVYLVANPKFKSVTLYDTNMERIGHRRREKQEKKEGKNQKQTQKPEGEESSPSAQKKPRKRRAKSI
ncbi:hypothetical protein [Flagellimonas sp.]|uniref:hypothetical protein n=1 Tax=Flagellimonas sp. TaxID=2058762 RepID=UPI003AB34465